MACEGHAYEMAPESFDNLLDLDLLSSDNSTFRSFPLFSDNVNAPQGNDEDEDELPRLRLLLNPNSTSSAAEY